MDTRCVICGRSDDPLVPCEICLSDAYCGQDCLEQHSPTHNKYCAPQNYILRVDLELEFIKNPRITRTLSCPAKYTFRAFHRALQFAFGWSSSHVDHHLYEFEVFDSDEVGAQSILTITDLQANEYNQDIGPRRVRKDSSKLHLFKVFDDPETHLIKYSYDFSDGWEHFITIIGREEPSTNFICLEGEGHPAAEDVGGSHGWNQLLQAYDARNPTEEQKSKMKWYETCARNGDPNGLHGDLKWKWSQGALNAYLRAFSVPKPVSQGIFRGEKVKRRIRV